ncbi:MAG: hypothetical protein VZR06_09465 [Butyrivibrio sp.]|nr:hypothetical protein [Butyrivibrio sp.]
MSLENDNNVNEGSVEDVVERYRPEIQKLTPFLKWLRNSARIDVAQTYSNSELNNTMSIPVYDSNLLAFVKAAQSTNLLDRNYVYVYSRNRLRDYRDELLFIDRAGITDMDDLAGILSKYILSGMTKGSVWAEGVKNGVLYTVVTKMDELVKFWDKTLENEQNL